MQPTFQEFGKSPFENHTREIASLKHTIDHGTYSIDYLTKTHPYICTRYIGPVLKYIHDVTTNPNVSHALQQQSASKALVKKVKKTTPLKGLRNIRSGFVKK